MKHVSIYTFIVLALTASTFPAMYGGGTGTAEDPYQIWTAEGVE